MSRIWRMLLHSVDTSEHYVPTSSFYLAFCEIKKSMLLKKKKRIKARTTTKKKGLAQSRHESCIHRARLRRKQKNPSFLVHVFFFYWTKTLHFPPYLHRTSLRETVLHRDAPSELSRRAALTRPLELVEVSAVLSASPKWPHRKKE